MAPLDSADLRPAGRLDIEVPPTMWSQTRHVPSLEDSGLVTHNCILFFSWQITELFANSAFTAKRRPCQWPQAASQVGILSRSDRPTCLPEIVSGENYGGPLCPNHRASQRCTVGRACPDFDVHGNVGRRCL